MADSAGMENSEILGLQAAVVAARILLPLP